MDAVFEVCPELVIRDMKIKERSFNENFLETLFFLKEAGGGGGGAVIPSPAKSYLVEILFKSKG